MRDTSQYAQLVSQLIQIAESAMEDDSIDANAVFKTAQDSFAKAIGHQLFTILRYLPASGEVERVYSNQAAAYPVAGRKLMGPTAWGDQVLGRGEPYIGRSADDIRCAFPDHELILSLGFESTLNLPIIDHTRENKPILGTVNLLHHANFCSNDDIEIGMKLAGCLSNVMWN